MRVISERKRGPGTFQLAADAQQVKSHVKDGGDRRRFGDPVLYRPSDVEHEPGRPFKIRE